MDVQVVSNSRLSLGQIVMTQGVVAANIKRVELFAALTKHSRGDWGSVSSVDWAENDAAVHSEGRILSAYLIEETIIWIITEADRSVTTFLLPSEY